jgi:hypothetical protein
MAVKRDINYLNKDFSEYRSQLINYTQTYFPTTYTDFSESSPGMMFMEQAAYVGDVLSYYIDNQVQENFLQYARQTNNLFDLAYMFNYKPKVTGLATTELEITQQVPSKLSASVYIPDFDYALYVEENTSVTTTNADATSFIIEDPIDFTVSNSLDPTEVSIAQTSAGNPTYFLLKKKRNAISATINSTTATFTNPQEFPTITIEGSDIAGIIDIVDSDGNEYYEVDYLAQDMVFDSIKNTNVNDPNNYSEADTPYLLKLIQTQRRFVTRFLNETTLQLQFGSGNPATVEEDIVPNPFNVGLGLTFGMSKLTTAYSPTNFIFTNTYGIAPSNTTLTIRYYTGGGTSANVLSNTLTSIDKTTVNFLKSSLTDNTAQYVFNSLASNNLDAASGGADGDTIEEIRQNSISQYSTQRRSVTADDYLIRTLSMPGKFGIVSKAFTQKPNPDDANTTLDIYLLSQNSQGQLAVASNVLKTNVKNYLNQYRMIGDSITLRDAFIINICVRFEITTLPNYNNSEVLKKCISSLQTYFDINKWQINQPILLGPIFVLLDEIQGVQTVKEVVIENKVGTDNGYSAFAYDISSATQDNVIYPSLDPMIFEVKYPNTDILGKVVTM